MSDYKDLGNQVISRVADEDHRRRLDGMLVDPSLADDGDYIPRVLPGDNTEIALYLRAIEVGKPVMLMGPAGSGKTLSPFYFGAVTGLPIAVIEGHNGFDPELVWATRDQNPETGMWGWEASDPALVWRYGGIILIDELYRIPAKSAGVLFPIMDARRRLTMPNKETVKAADTLLIVSTTNPPSYAGVGEVDEALKDRHSPVLMWDYDPAVEAKLIRSVSLRKMAKDVRERGELEGVMSTRNLVEFEDLVDDLGWEMARAGLLGRFVEYEQLTVASVLDNWGPKIRAELGR